MSKIVVEIDSDLEEIIPSFMKGREKDVGLLEEAVGAGDFEKIQSIGHKLKGNAGSYGFDHMGEIGAGIEQNAKDKNLPAIEKLFQEYREHLSAIEIKFV